MTKLFSYFALLLIFAALSTESAQAQTGLATSSWPSARHDISLTARAQVSGPSVPQLKWTVNFGVGRLGSPVTGADGTIYISGNENDTLYAVTSEGNSLWSFTGKKLANEQFVAPVVIGRDGVIYFGSTQNVFYAVNPDGSLRWQQTLGGAVRLSANIGNDGTIYVVGQDCWLYAMQPDGKIKWRAYLEKRAGSSGNGPALASDGTIYVVAGEFLMGFAPDGSQRLKVNCSDLGVLYGLVVDDFELIYVTGDVPRVRAISNSGATRWEYNFPKSFGAPFAPALGKDGSLYFASTNTGEVVALNHDGTKRWSYSVANAPSLTELSLDDSNHVYLVNDQRGLTSISAAGRLRWTMPEVHCQFSPGFGPDGTLYIGSDKKMYAVGAPAPKMAVSAIRLDGGQICVGSAATLELEISNPSSVDLEVHDLSVSGSVFQIVSRNFVLAPGGRQIVHVKFTPVKFMNYSATLTITSNAGTATVALSGAGTGPQISPVVDTLQFGELPVGKVASKLARVFNAACELRIDSVKIAGANVGAFKVDAAGLPKMLAQSDTAQLAVQFSPKVTDANQARLLIYSNDPQRNPLVVLLRGNGAASLPEIEVSPLALEFGENCRESQLYTVISNVGYITLRVDLLAFSNSAFLTSHASAFTIAPGHQDTVRVNFLPTAGVESTGKLAIYNNDRDEGLVEVTLHGSGGSPDIAGLPAVDFGVVNVQTCAGLANFATRTYVVRNEGGCDLQIDSLAVTGVFAIVSPRPPQRLAAGDSLTVTLNFVPVAAGEQSGALRIVSNDPDERLTVINLHGRAIAAPDIAVASDTLDFGSVLVNNKKELPLLVRNLGEVALTVTSLEFSSSRFSTATGPFVLACKQDSAVTVTFVPDSIRVFTGMLSIRSNDPDAPAVKIFLRGEGTKLVQPLIATDTSEYRFAPLCLDEKDSLRVVVMNKGDGALHVDSVRVLTYPQIFLKAVASFTLLPLQSKALTLYFAPAHPKAYQDVLQIFSNAGNGEIFTVGLHGLGSSAEISGLDEVSFAATKVDSTHREVYRVNNIGDCPLTLTSVYLEGENANEFDIVDAGAPVISPRGSTPVTLEFRPKASTRRVAKLIILSSDPVQPRFEISLEGSGDGKPGLLAGPRLIDFAKACFNETVTRECTLQNDGASEFKITQITTVRGEFFRIAGAVQLPLLLRPQNSVTLSLVFATGKSGVFNDTLLVQTDLPVNPLLRVGLIGAGRDDMAKFEVSQQTLSFSGHLDESKTAQVAITNMGCGPLEINRIELGRKLQVFGIRPEMPLPARLEKDQILNVIVSFKGNDFKAFADSLHIYCVDWEQKRERRSVNLLGKVMDGVPCLQAAFSKLEFGEVAIGQVKRLDLEVTNCSADSRIVVRAQQPASGDFKVLPDTLTIFPTNPQFFAVNFAPRRHGEIVDTLKLVFYALSAPSQSQTLKIILRGAATGTGNRVFALPNAFTPNGDGKNDLAKIHFSGYDAAALVLRVYDLRGLEVRLLRPARRGEFEIGWDGRNDRGDLQTPGAYLWLLEDNGKKVGSGQVVLIR